MQDVKMSTCYSQIRGVLSFGFHISLTRENYNCLRLAFYPVEVVRSVVAQLIVAFKFPVFT